MQTFLDGGQQQQKSFGLNRMIGLTELFITKGKYNCLLMRLFKEMSQIHLWIISEWVWGPLTVTCGRLDGALRTTVT